MSRVLRAALFATLALTGCGRSPGVADEELGNLVIAPRQTAAPINLDKAAKDPAELSRALARPYRDLVKALGPHSYAIASETLVDEAGKRVETLSDRASIENAANGTFHAVYTNSADYGREVTFVDGRLFLRPRYQRWHGRAPETPEEPVAVRDSFFEAIGATWDLLAPGAELTDGGAAQAANGRAGRKVIIKLSPSPRQPPSEPLLQRKWREKRTVEAVQGEIVLDSETGLPLTAKLQGIVSFTRDGRRFSMKLNVDGAAAALGDAAIVAPPGDQVVATPERLREVDDRDFLLQGIAPPSRRNPDGTPVAPSPKFRDGSGGSAGSNSPKE